VASGKRPRARSPPRCRGRVGRLPDGDGLKLIGELRKASPGVRVLVISAYEELVNRREAIEAGAPDRTIRWGSALTMDAYLAGRLLHSGSSSCSIPWSAWKGFLRTSVRSRESFAAPRLRS
jgi:CheY-like chemotaxis protein